MAEPEKQEQSVIGSKEFLTDMAKGGPLAAVVAFLGWFLTTQLGAVADDIADLRDEIKAMEVSAALGNADRWSATEHRAYVRERDAELREITARLSRLEEDARDNAKGGR